MGKTWTDEQRQVIELRDRSLLVSAAAGSGKTAVLVERIIRRITDRQRPIDIDKLLVVTFTRAAAAEMRERIMAAIEEGLEKTPEDSHLQKQKMLLPSAAITTIDSFCMSVLREHFDCIRLDPGFRVGDPQEIILLKQDTVKKLLDDYYEKKLPEFQAFIDTYASGKLDRGIAEWILKIYDFSQSHPWPDEWLSQSLKLNPGNWDGTGDNPVIHLIMEESRKILLEIKEILENGRCLSMEAGGPSLYEPILLDDLEQVETMISCRFYSELSRAVEKMAWKRLPGKKQPEADPSKTDEVKVLRQEAKNLLSWLKKNYFAEPLDVLLERERKIYPGLQMLISLTKEFSARFQEEKRARNLIDFNDQEHLALKVLLDEDHEPTAAARSYSEQFEEIMCDEYQDSNQVQETLLNSISRERKEQPNQFMVGDVKQSIYRFRMAEPEIFLGKYQTYSKSEGKHQRIDLHKNFRSRPCVLYSINRIFEAMMTPEICGMEYDEDAALNPGLKYEQTDRSVAEDAEWLMVDYERQPDVSKKEAEARAVGIRIKELMDVEKGLWIMDPDTGRYRKADYGDIVILLRTVKGWTEDFVRILKNMGIPAVGETTSGFFDTLEIQGILNMLRILDNPLQDIPMAAVLRSVMGNFTDDELARLRMEDMSAHLYENMRRYREEGPDENLCTKLSDFLKQYEYLRRRKVHITIEELIYEIYEQTGYVQYMFAMAGGEVRRANLERLIEYARDFQNTSYRGLFHFIRYVDQLKEAKEDLGEVVLPGEGEQMVRIMSIHKSKGLEYPICFVAGLGKNMNFTESRSRIVVHAGYGVAADGIDLEKRVKLHGLSKKVVARKLLQDQMGEEIRVLYVAMTRAREKLILTGALENMEKTAEKWALAGSFGKALSYSRMIRAKSYLDWIGPLLWSDGRQGESFGFKFRCLNMAHLAMSEIRQEIKKDAEREVLQIYRNITPAQKLLYDEIDIHMDWRYPKEIMTRLQGKMTVSELKKMAGETMTGKVLIPQTEKTVRTSGDSSIYMAQQKGTATHKIFELLPFDKIHTEDDIEAFVQHCVRHELIPDFWAELIPVSQIFDFCMSDLGQRMAGALKEKRLYRERPFVMGIPMCEIYPDIEENDRILIQGVIDVYFEEADGVVLLDYKTDRIPCGNAGDMLLVKRYKAQLDYYQRAIEQITGKKVTERILYSVLLNRQIHC